jgi:DNA-binding LytR/AlgR family response regulator
LARIDGVTNGGTADANRKTRLTSGGPNGANGGTIPRWRQPQWLTAATFVGFGAIHVIVNATSLIDERRDLGQPVTAWQPWVWETTSFLAWLLLLPVILWAAIRIASIGRPVVAVALHLLMTAPVSLTHSTALFALRTATYSMVDESYDRPGSLVDVLIYEYRKDAITYALIVFAFLLIRRLATPLVPAPAAVEEARIEVREGSRTVWLRPDEIDWVAAAGNYVEINGAFGTKLARRTLAEIETELVRIGFARIHRSRLVRTAAIETIETRQSGDFDVILRSGQTISGSRRYRNALEQALTHPKA